MKLYYENILSDSEVFMTTAALSGKIEMLPPHKQQEVSDFVDFLLASANAKDNSAAARHPYAGCMSGTFGEMSEGFNEPLALISEKTLAKDWLLPEEDKTWKFL